MNASFGQVFFVRIKNQYRTTFMNFTQNKQMFIMSDKCLSVNGICEREK